MRRVLLLTLLVLVAGCSSPSQPDGPPAGGGDGEDQSWKLITWRQPGLHNAFPDPPEQGGYQVAHHAADGIPVPETSLGGALGPLALAQLIWRGPAQDTGPQARNGFTLDEAGNATALLDASFGEAEAREAFETFTAELTRADQATVDGWFNGFWESRREAGAGPSQDEASHYAYQVRLDGPWRMGAFIAERNGTEEATLEVNPTSLRLVSGAWEISIERPFKEAALQMTGEATRQLGVNTRNVALFLVGEPGELTDEQAGEHLNATFEDLGLGTPEPGNWSFRVFEPN